MRFKHSKVKGIDYLQIWSDDGDYVMSAGCADKLHAKLVRLELLEKQTNKYNQIKTNLLRDDDDDKD